MGVFLREISDYFEQLSIEHLDVAHSRTAAAFCRYNDNEQFAQLRNNAAKNIVVIKSFFGKAAGDIENAGVRNTLVIGFSCYAKSLLSKDIVEASEKSFAILVDFWRRTMQDFEEDNCAWLKGVDFENIQFDEIEQPWLQNHYGWDLIIPYKTTLPGYDETKWRTD